MKRGHSILQIAVPRPLSSGNVQRAEKVCARKKWLVLTLFLGSVVGVLFVSIVLSGPALFSNDRPWPMPQSALHQSPGALIGLWNIYNWLGLGRGSAHQTLPKMILGDAVLADVASVYQVKYLWHHFVYYKVPSLDFPWEPRRPAEIPAFRTMLGKNISRVWRLEDRRYLVGTRPALDALNMHLGPRKHWIRTVLLLGLRQDPLSRFIGARANGAGPSSLMEFARALRGRTKYCASRGLILSGNLSGVWTLLRSWYPSESFHRVTLRGCSPPRCRLFLFPQATQPHFEL